MNLIYPKKTTSLVFDNMQSVYVIAGLAPLENVDQSNKCEKFNISNEKQEELADHPYKTRHFGISYSHDLILTFGGSFHGCEDKICSYDTYSNRWFLFQNRMPQKAKSCSAVFAQDMDFIFLFDNGNYLENTCIFDFENFYQNYDAFIQTEYVPWFNPLYQDQKIFMFDCQEKFYILDLKYKTWQPQNNLPMQSQIEANDFQNEPQANSPNNQINRGAFYRGGGGERGGRGEYVGSGRRRGELVGSGRRRGEYVNRGRGEYVNRGRGEYVDRGRGEYVGSGRRRGEYVGSGRRRGEYVERGRNNSQNNKEQAQEKANNKL